MSEETYHQSKRQHMAVLEQNKHHARRRTPQLPLQVVWFADEVGRNANHLVDVSKRLVVHVEEVAASTGNCSPYLKSLCVLMMVGPLGMSECCVFMISMKRIVQLPLLVSSNPTMRFMSCLGEIWMNSEMNYESAGRIEQTRSWYK